MRFPKCMSRWVRPAVALLLILLLAVPPLAASGDEDGDRAPGRKMADQATKKRHFWVTSDHSRMKELQQTFNSGDDITKACLSCHNKADEQIRKTLHWTWTDPNAPADNRMGKAQYSVNNFCISTNLMHDKKCSSCHIGWNGKKGQIDCLKCHGQTEFNFSEAFEDYHAFHTSDDPEERELAKEIQESIQEAVQAVGRPTRRNCGSCHFRGGGGDGVKHGDLDSSMTKPNKSLDVHMGIDGQDFQCVRCHTTISHNIAGRIYGTPAAMDRKSLIQNDLASKIMCESCHGDKPHKAGSKPNDHTDKVACQACHIPTVARVLPTKVWWDWSKAGKLKDGKPYNEEGPLGKHIYMSIKGEMKWAKNLVPEYMWFNGSIKTKTAKDMIDPGNVVNVGWPVGDRNDPNARIFPFKVHRGRQPYDTVNKTLLAPLLSGPHGYWTTFDWQDALTRGQKFLGLPYSGSFDFVETRYVFPSTHMVAPKDKALACIDCHRRPGSRLACLTGFYMPGRDRIKLLDMAGWGLVLAALLGVSLHALGRIVSRNGRRK